MMNYYRGYGCIQVYVILTKEYVSGWFLLFWTPGGVQHHVLMGVRVELWTKEKVKGVKTSTSLPLGKKKTSSCFKYSNVSTSVLARRLSLVDRL